MIRLPDHALRSDPWPRVAAALLAAMLVCPPAVASSGMESLVDAFDAAFQRELSERRVPGGAYVIVHRGQIARMSAFGHADGRGSRPVDAHTRFRIASLSKGFSGVLAAMLAAEQRFALEQPVATYVPAFELKPEPRPLTIEDVLGQRSGFVRNAYDNLIEAGVSRDDIIPRFNTLQPLCAPGRCYSYQNNVFSLVEDVIGKTTGDRYAEVLEHRLLRPLGMTGASVGFDPFVDTENRAEPHLKTRSGWFHSEPRPTYYQVPSAAGINASIVDMAQWALAMLGHRPDVVPASVIDEVLAPRIRTSNELRKRHWRGRLDDAWYGLGWRLYQVGAHRLAVHGGWVAGYRAEIALSRELDLGLVILTNAETRAVGALNRLFWDHALAPERVASIAGDQSAADAPPGS